MEFIIDKDGKISVTKPIELSDYSKKELIKKIVADDGNYDDEAYHNRWSILYNAYDLVYNTDIRQLHVDYGKFNCTNVTRLEFISRTGRLDKLFYVATNLFKRETEDYIMEYIG